MLPLKRFGRVENLKGGGAIGSRRVRIAEIYFRVHEFGVRSLETGTGAVKVPYALYRVSAQAGTLFLCPGFPVICYVVVDRAKRRILGTLPPGWYVGITFCDRPVNRRIRILFGI